MQGSFRGRVRVRIYSLYSIKIIIYGRSLELYLIIFDVLTYFEVSFLKDVK